MTITKEFVLKCNDLARQFETDAERKLTQASKELSRTEYERLVMYLAIGANIGVRAEA